MERKIIEPESIDNPEEIISFDKATRMFYFWLLQPQIKAALRLLNQGYSEKERVTLLDVGCGTGRVLIGIAKKMPQIKFYGIDISRNMLKIASQNINQNGLRNSIALSCQDARHLTFREKYFDVVVCSNTLHHLADPLPLLKEIKRVLKDNGKILIRDILRPRSEFLLNFSINLFGLFYNKLMKKGYRESLYNAFSVEEFKQLLTTSGIEGKDISVSFPHFITIVGEKTDEK